MPITNTNMPITITNVVNVFVRNCKTYLNDRYRSYEHCRKCFLDNKYFPAKYDLITLHLYAYLASWGMLRNSFLLHKDYLFNKPVVEILCKPEYDCLKYFDQFGPNAKYYLGRIMKLKEEISDYYNGKTYIIKPKTGNNKTIVKTINKVSDTLVSKIILGTLGCIPAYDQFFIKGLKKYNEDYKLEPKIMRRFRKDSLEKLIDFAKANKIEIEDACNKLNNACGVKGLYTPMKVIDMYFWELG